MKRNFNVVVKNHDGQPNSRQVFTYDEAGLPVLNNDLTHKFKCFEPMTLQRYALDALYGRWRGEEGLTHEAFWKRMKLADRIATSADGAVELEAEEAKIILDALNKKQETALVIGRMKDLLDSDPEVKPPADSGA